MTIISFNLKKDLLDSLEKRTSVLIDTNIWIKISEQKTSEAKNIRYQLKRLVDKKIIFCPLVPETIWELRKQKGKSLQLTIETMEDLSENVSFRSYNDICSNETEGFIRHILYGSPSKVNIGDIYAPIFGYLAPGFNLEFPEGWSDRDKNSLKVNVRSTINKMSLSEFIILIEGAKPKEKSTPPAYKKANTYRSDFCKKNILKMRKIEQESVVNNTIKPIFFKKIENLPPLEKLHINKVFCSLLKKKEYESILLHFPIVQACVEVMTISGLDINRNDSYRDFYDRGIMITALSYMGIFASDDRWINSLMNSDHLKKRRNKSMEYCRTLTSLEKALAKIEGI